MRHFIKSVILTCLALFSTGAAQEGDTRVVLTASNTLVLDEAFTDTSVAKVEIEARRLNAGLAKGKPLYLVLVTPGGSISAGNELIDNLNALGRPVHTVSLFAASMGFQTIQGLDTRYVTESGTLMSHKAKGGFEGEFPGQVNSRLDAATRMIDRLDRRTVARSHGKLTLESYRALYANEYWCDGQDCVDKGVADEVASVVCDSTLDGTKETTVHESFFGIPVEVKVTRANCPTITGALDVKVALAANTKKNQVDVNDFDAVKGATGLDYDRAKQFQAYLLEQVSGYFKLDKSNVQRY